jgi:hypothetical protein
LRNRAMLSSKASILNFVSFGSTLSVRSQ